VGQDERHKANQKKSQFGIPKNIKMTKKNCVQIPGGKAGKTLIAEVSRLIGLFNTFHSGVRDTCTFLPTLAYQCTSILVLAIPCHQVPPRAQTPACTVGCQRLPPANTNSRLAKRHARGCSKSQITNITFIIGIHSQSGQ